MGYKVRDIRATHYYTEDCFTLEKMAQLKDNVDGSMRDIAITFLPVASRSPYLLSGEEAYGVVRPLLGPLEADLRRLGAETRARRDDSGEAPLGRSFGEAEQQAAYTPAHTARQVGLVYGALTARRMQGPTQDTDVDVGVDGGLEGSLPRFSGQWYKQLESQVGQQACTSPSHKRQEHGYHFAYLLGTATWCNRAWRNA